MASEDSAQALYTLEEVAEKHGITPAEVKKRRDAHVVRPASFGRRGEPLFDEAAMEQLGVPRLDARKARAKRGGPLVIKRPRDVPKPGAGVVGAAYSGEEAAAVFKLLGFKKSLHEIVVLTKIVPRVVEAIASDYRTLGKGLVLTHAEVERLNALSEKLDGVFPVTSGEALVEIVEAAARTVCAACKERPKVVCRTCARKLPRE